MDVVNARDYINPHFMGLSAEEISELDKEITKLQSEATYQMERAPWVHNDRPEQADVVQIVEDGEPRGGASE